MKPESITIVDNIVQTIIKCVSFMKERYFYSSTSFTPMVRVSCDMHELRFSNERVNSSSTNCMAIDEASFFLLFLVVFSDSISLEMKVLDRKSRKIDN